MGGEGLHKWFSRHGGARRSMRVGVEGCKRKELAEAENVFERTGRA